MHGDNPWRGYAEMFNLYAVQKPDQTLNRHITLSPFFQPDA
jgi:hypothetical protein